MTLTRFVEVMRNEFRRLDADRDGEIGTADASLHDSVESARRRGAESMRIMSHDLDGDGAVTADEVRRVLRYDGRLQPGADPAGQVDEQIDRAVGQIMAADADRDGRVGRSEADLAAKARLDALQPWADGFGPRVRELVELAGMGQSTFRMSDLDRVAEAAFRTVDTDHNGTLSQDEFEAVRSSRQQVTRQRSWEQRQTARLKQEAEQAATCAVPKASEAAKVILLGGYETESLSTVALGSQDVVTHAGDLVIEPGSGPLYVVVATHANVVWRVSGEVDRLERLVLGAGSGATGVAADRIAFVPARNCLTYFNEAPSLQSAKSAAFVARIAGKPAETVVGGYELGTAALPSAQLRATAPGTAGPHRGIIVPDGDSLRPQANRGVETEMPAPRNLERELRRFNPGGVADIDPATVVARVPVARYEVLPQQAGLIQLVQAGALSQNRSGEFLIHRKVRFPAGLAGAHSVKFLLLRGVPLPEGDHGHSTVISEETGEPLPFGR